MKIGHVAGTVVSTISHEFFDSRRLLLCVLIDPDGTERGYVIAVDTVGAGVGEDVLIIDEGNSSRQIFELTTAPIRTTIVGIIDSVDV